MIMDSAAGRVVGRPTADVALNYGHAIRCQRSSFVGADGCRVAHRLTRVQVPHQIIIRHHFLHHTQHWHVRTGGS